MELVMNNQNYGFEETPEANKQRLKNYLRERPHATMEEICFDFDLSSRTIYRYLADLGLSLASANGSANVCAKPVPLNESMAQTIIDSAKSLSQVH